jgi:hypothetical protein
MNESCIVCCVADIVLVDKLIVHDMENMRLGWVDYDCEFESLSSSLTVSCFNHLLIHKK